MAGSGRGEFLAGLSFAHEVKNDADHHVAVVGYAFGADPFAGAALHWRSRRLAASGERPIVSVVAGSPSCSNQTLKRNP